VHVVRWRFSYADQKRTLYADMYRALRPGGQIVIADLVSASTCAGSKRRDLQSRRVLDERGTRHLQHGPPEVDAFGEMNVLELQPAKRVDVFFAAAGNSAQRAPKEGASTQACRGNHVECISFACGHAIGTLCGASAPGEHLVELAG